MGGGEVAASIIDSLAWPLTTILLVVLIIVVFEKPLTELIARVRTISVKDLTVELAAQLRRTQARPTEPTVITPRAQDAIRHDPLAAIIESWMLVESHGRLLLLDHDTAEDPGSPRTLLRMLLDASIVDANGYTILTGLLNIRNIAVHSRQGNITAEVAQSYCELCDEAMDVIFGPEAE